MSSSKDFLDEYIVLRNFNGGFATVYKVRDKNYGNLLAVKVLNKDVESEDDPVYIHFKRECKNLLKLGNGGHPNIVHIHRPLTLCGNKAFVEMDYVDGTDLLRYVEDNNSFVPIKEVIKFLTDISSALSYCHVDVFRYSINRDEDNLPTDPHDGQKVIITDECREMLIKKYRIIHNDMQSRNIIRRFDGTYIMIDFGLAVSSDEVNQEDCITNGALEYKAPEKWQHLPITPSVDIYGLGVMLYEFMTGQVPFPFHGNVSDENDKKAYQEIICNSKPRPIFPLRKSAFENAHPDKTLDEPDYPHWLEHLIMKCLEKNPSDRFAHGKELFDFVNNQFETELDAANNKVKSLQHEYELKRKENDEAMKLVKEQLEVEKELAQQRIVELKELHRKESDEAAKNARILLKQREKEIEDVQKQVIELENKLEQQKQEAEVQKKLLMEQYQHAISEKLRQDNSSEPIIDAVISNLILADDKVELLRVENDNEETPFNDTSFIEIPVIELVRIEK